MNEILIETRRLQLRRLVQTDAAALQPILQDAEVMYAWEHSFSDAEVQEWLLENLRRYESDGYSYMAALSRANGELIGVTGLLTEHIGAESHLGIGWIFQKRFWGQGLAFEAAKALLCHAFEVLKAESVIATIRPENQASRNLAERLGMQQSGSFLKPYQGRELLHFIYKINRNNWKSVNANNRTI